MSDDARAGGKDSFCNVLPLPPARTVTYLQKYNFTTDYFYGSNDFTAKGDGYIRKSAANGEALYGGAIICVRLSGKY